MTATRRTATRTPPAELAGRGALRWVDDRLGGSTWLRSMLNKIFPDHWSFMLGEIALYSFVVLLITGTFLALFFTASPKEVVYHGSYLPLRGVSMSQAYESTLHISFDVRGGLLMRQIHHWAALLFVSSIVVHLCRIFFTGAFRKPREINWVIGVVLLILAIAEGFAGYSLPDDLLSGTGIRIAFSVVESIPIVGSWLGFLVFGSNFPGDNFIQRLYLAHILLIPGLLLALVGLHLAILVRQKHTDFPGPGKSEQTIVGSRMWPGFALKTQGFLFIVFGVLAALGGLFEINPIWLYGPYNAANVSAGSQPDWYIGFLEGSLRLMPGLETTFLGHTIDWNIFIPAVILPGLLFTLLLLYPFIEAWWTGDRRHHNLLERPRDNPTRTAIGAMSLSFYLVLWLAGGNDILATTFSMSVQALSWAFRVALFLVPPIAYVVARRMCLALQRREREDHEHGVESGLIHRLPSGEYVEVHVPLPTPEPPDLVPLDAETETALTQLRLRPGAEASTNGGNGHGGVVSRAGRAVSEFFFERGDTRRRDDDD